MITIAPSLLSADFADLRGQIALAEQGGANWLHVDVMDGHFVPNLTIGPPVIRSIRKLTSLPFDTHLMIENPDAFIDAYRAAGADIITVHQEACVHLHRTIQRIRQSGALAGVSINPATPVAMLSDIITEVDLVLIMSVNPGFGGQLFIPSASSKIRELTRMIRDRKARARIEVDGGIDPQTAPVVVAAGASILVAGSAIFGSPDIPRAISALRRAAESPTTA
jgi:ribulose-phosphate 3-epimerase